MAVQQDFFEELVARNLVQDTTDRDSLEERLAEGPIGAYIGFDPTAQSLHVGNLVGVLLLKRFQQAGHRAVALSGGATGMVGDPSGKSDERNLLDDQTLKSNLERVQAQLSQFLDFEGDNPAEIVDNYDWTSPVSALEFMRDIGKHVTVNQMMAKDSVKSRLNSDTGISYTEFSYMLLQAFDFFWLHENKNIEMQMGGSDQWGNVSLGAELIRKKSGEKAHALTHPLMLKSDGSKYGKTAGGETLWLDPEMMSPYRFYQAWIQVEDTEVEKLLLWLTFLSVDEIKSAVASHHQEPHLRAGQKLLAFELTKIVHGVEAGESAVAATEALFGKADLKELEEGTLKMLRNEVPGCTLTRSQLEHPNNLVDILVDAEVVASKSEALRMIKQNAVSVNGVKAAEETSITASDVLAGSYVFLHKGKKVVHLVEFE